VRTSFDPAFNIRFLYLVLFRPIHVSLIVRGDCSSVNVQWRHSRCSAANWSEVAQKVRETGADWASARALLSSYGLRVEPVILDDAERAAELWLRGSGLSLADRLCLALGERLDARIDTVDRAWSLHDKVDVIR
jgi:PIN domain nuclease of toxin-antitoxin system